MDKFRVYKIAETDEQAWVEFIPLAINLGPFVDKRSANTNVQMLNKIYEMGGEDKLGAFRAFIGCARR